MSYKRPKRKNLFFLFFEHFYPLVRVKIEGYSNGFVTNIRFLYFMHFLGCKLFNFHNTIGARYRKMVFYTMVFSIGHGGHCKGKYKEDVPKFDESFHGKEYIGRFLSLKIRKEYFVCQKNIKIKS